MSFKKRIAKPCYIAGIILSIFANVVCANDDSIKLDKLIREEVVQALKLNIEANFELNKVSKGKLIVDVGPKQRSSENMAANPEESVKEKYPDSGLIN